MRPVFIPLDVHTMLGWKTDTQFQMVGKYQVILDQNEVIEVDN